MPIGLLAMLYAKLLASCLNATQQPIWLSMHINMLAELCAGLLANCLNALQKPICAIDINSDVWGCLPTA